MVVGGALCLNTKWMRGKMPTPICCPRKRPVAFTKSSVSCFFYKTVKADGLNYFSLTLNKCACVFFFFFFMQEYLNKASYA